MYNLFFLLKNELATLVESPAKRIPNRRNTRAKKIWPAIILYVKSRLNCQFVRGGRDFFAHRKNTEVTDKE